LIEVWLVENLWWIVAALFITIGFWQFRKWNIARFIEKQKTIKYKSKNDTMPDVDIMQYVTNPEETIKALKIKRGIHEKAGDTASIASVDTEIQVLQAIAKIPAPGRPYAAKFLQIGMKKIEKIMDNF